jgi:hypothetical protein
MSYAWVLSTLCCAAALGAMAIEIPRAKPESNLIFFGPEPMASRRGIHFFRSMASPRMASRKWHNVNRRA